MDIAPILARISPDCIAGTVKTLAEDPLPVRKLNFTLPGHSRNTLYEADDWIESRFRSWGYDVRREGCPVKPFGRDRSRPARHQYCPPDPGVPEMMAYNLYAERRGRLRPDDVLLLLAHKDSQSWIDSPGAYDNATGTAAVLEIARVIADVTPESTVRFLFCNEEHTPWTSVTAAQNARARGDRLLAIYNVDSVGGKSDEDILAGRKTNVTLYTSDDGKRFADLMAWVNGAFGIGLVQSAYRRDSLGDDDGSFVQAGYGCAVANIGSYPYADSEYHLEGDTPGRVDVENVAMAARATLAAVLTLDSEPGWG